MLLLNYRRLFNYQRQFNGKALHLSLPILLCSLFCSEGANGAVYRCEVPDKPVLYSQFQCPPRHQQSTITPEAENLIDIPALSKAETEALRALKKTLADNRAQAQRIRLKAREHRARQMAQDKSRCEAAGREIAALQQHRRKGYSAGEARHLARRDRELKQIIKTRC